MKAAVCFEFGRPLVVEQVEIDPPQRGEVMIELAATAICHSDVHFVRGEWGGRTPVVAGHESSGTVVALGEGVDSLQAGERVVVSLLRACGDCKDCRRGAPNLCSGVFALDKQPRLRSKDGTPIYQGIKTGSFAEYTIVDQSQCVRIPDDMPAQSAALLGCGVITGLGAVINTAGVEAGSRVAIIGAGGVGLNAIQGAVLQQAETIIAIDTLDEKLAMAQSFGATHTLNAAVEDPIKAVRALTGGAGVDYAFATVGSVQAIEGAFKMLRRGGTLVVVGLPQVTAKIELRVHSLVAAERRVLGSFMGSTRLHEDVPRLVEYYQQGRLKLDELISDCYPLERINEAIAAMEAGSALRNLIVFS